MKPKPFFADTPTSEVAAPGRDRLAGLREYVAPGDEAAIDQQHLFEIAHDVLKQMVRPNHWTRLPVEYEDGKFIDAPSVAVPVGDWKKKYGNDACAKANDLLATAIAKTLGSEYPLTICLMNPEKPLSAQHEVLMAFHFPGQGNVDETRMMLAPKFYSITEALKAECFGIDARSNGRSH